MKKNKILSLILGVSMALTAIAMPVMAAGFPDVDNDPTVSWAKEAITEMSEAGYIKGYEDGTFKPYRSISKLECLLLMSRMLGAEEEAYQEISDRALEEYSETVAKYNASYPRELSYLLYLGILDQGDLIDYASVANANTELARYQAAMLMAKLLGEDEIASRYKAETPSYGDDAQLPILAKPYIEYVTAQGIMNGMDQDANGKTVFSPMTYLTRSQMATLLSRMIEKIDKLTYTNPIQNLNWMDHEIAVSILPEGGKPSLRKVTDSTIVRKDGEIVELSELKEGDTVTVVEVGGHMQLIEIVSPTEDAEISSVEVFAIVTQTTESPAGKKITLEDTEDETNTVTYDVAEDCTYQIKGTQATFNDLRRGDFIKVTVKNGKVVAIESGTKNMLVKGKLTAVDFDDDNHVYLTVQEENENEQQYVVSAKGAVVNRDELTAEYRDLAIGDTVELELTYGKVVRVDATSQSEKFTGILTQIIIASQPAVTISVDGVETTYKLRSDAKITIAGAASTIYDLRPNITISGVLESSEVKTLTTSSVNISEKGSYNGVVSGVNTNYKVITVEDEDGISRSVYYSSKTNFLKSSGEATTIRSIQKGVKVDVTGEEKNGIFEANIIIIK